MSVGLSKDQLSAGPINVFGDGAYTDSRGGRFHLRPETCHWDRSMALSEDVPALI